MRNTCSMRPSHKTSFGWELLAGISLFLSCLYIMVLLPHLFSSLGIPFSDTYTATCLTLFLATLSCGLITKKPYTIGPGVAIASYMIHAMQHDQLNPSQVFLSGLMAGLIGILLLSARSIRVRLFKDIPPSLNAALVAGIGLLIMSVGVDNATVEWTSLINTVLDWAPLWIGVLVIAILDYNRIPGAIIFGILITTGMLAWQHPIHIDHIFSADISLHLPILTWGKQSFSSSMIPVVFSLTIITLFDCFGTLLGMSQLLKESNVEINQVSQRRTLFLNSFSSLFASSLGTANTSIYIESASAIRSGGRTGYTAIIAAVLFGSTLFFAPIIEKIPAAAASPALIYVGLCMLKQLKNVDFKHFPSIIAMLAMVIIIPLRGSIADGFGIGFILYTLLSFRDDMPRSKRTTLVGIALVFMLYFIIRYA